MQMKSGVLLVLGVVIALAVALLLLGVPRQVPKPRPAPRMVGLPAFPGAEGYGADTPGGRGGAVIEVTNLAPDGPGSFRAACATPGPRVIVFKVGGTIVIDDELRIEEPFVTIAGQTAPGDGICIRGGTLVINTHDVILRGLRVRPGDDPVGPWPGARDALSIQGPGAHDIIVDHCSFSWAVDENIDTWYGVEDVTLQWCIVSEGLKNSIHPDGPAGLGFLIGHGSERISVHHNLFAHNYGRNPMTQHDASTEIVNNVIYNWGYEGAGYSGSGGTFQSNVIGNYFRPGIDSFPARKGILIWRGAGSRLYVEGNVGPGRTEGKSDEWDAVTLFPGAGGKLDYYSMYYAVAPSGIETSSVPKMARDVLRGAGATAPARDSVDARVIKSVKQGSGHIIDTPYDVGGYPFYSDGFPQSDRDHDGMSDRWERRHELNPLDPADAALPSPRGYSWVEEYVNALF